ncbi:MAG: ArgE/DapE family deacylase [Synergistaceae bacterium]|nr:ArgE/DapE family deacylase [Synergistaceae bacterium]
MKHEECRPQVLDSVLKAVDARRDEMVELARELIRFPTTKGNEAEAQAFYAEKLKELGAEVESFEPDIEHLTHDPAFVTDRKSFEGSPVVAATLKGSGGGRSLILCGHMDVVDPGAAAWTHSPWDPVVKDGRVYGRGSVDMKGGVAAHYIAAKVIRDMGIELRGDLKILSTVDEECGSCGVLALIDRGYRADAAICTEPVGLKITIATTGSVWFKISVPGKAAHGGIAYSGVNSIYKSIPIIERIRALEEERRLRLFGSVPVYDGAPIAFCAGVNKIEGGVWPAIVPALTTLEGRVGLSPLEKVEDVKRELEDAVSATAKADPWLSLHAPEIEYYKSRWNSGCVEEAHPFVEALRRSFAQSEGRDGVMAGMFACSDSGTLITFGGTPAVDFGPGPQDMAHKTDEYVDIDDLVATSRVVAATILNWCGAADAGQTGL